MLWYAVSRIKAINVFERCVCAGEEVDEKPEGECGEAPG